MQFDDDILTRIFDKKDGHCNYCVKKLAWRNYGNPDGRGGWEVDHSIPRSKGGTNHLNNLVPSCINCNRSKGNLTGRQYKRINEINSTDSEDILSGLIIFGGILLLFVLFGARASKNKRNF